MEWDKYVPIKSDGNTTSVFLTNMIDTPDKYNELVYSLDNASSHEKFHIYINSEGGEINSAMMIINSIKNTKATVHAILSGRVESAATLIALSCDTIEVTPFTTMLIHDYSFSIESNSSDIKTTHEFFSKHISKIYFNTYNNFLTPSEIRRVLNGKDYRFDEFQIKERLSSI